MFTTVGGRVIPGTFARSSPAWLDGVEYANNVPRFPSQSGTVGVTVEEAGTNIALRSEALTTAPWGGSGHTLTAALSPRGDMTAWRIQSNTSSGNVLQAVTVTASTTYTLSFYAKNNGGTAAKYRVYNNSGSAEIIAPASFFSSINGGTWSRVSVTFTTPVGCTSIGIYVSTYSLDTIDFLAWGVQLEAKAYATTYIPTAAATVTRNAETLTVPTQGLLTPSAGTVTLDYTQRVALGATRVLWHCEIDANNYWSLLVHSTGRPYFEIKSGGVIYSTYNASNAIPAAGSRVRVTLRFNGATATHYANGTKSAAGDVAYTAPVGTFPALMWIGSGVSAASPSNIVAHGLHTYTDAMTDAEGVAASLGSPPSDFTAYFNFQTGYVRGFTPGSNPAYVVDLFRPLS